VFVLLFAIRKQSCIIIRLQNYENILTFANLTAEKLHGGAFYGEIFGENSANGIKNEQKCPMSDKQGDGAE